MHKVLIFKETLLPPSETFILAQMNSLRTFAHLLAGLERTMCSLPLVDPLLLSPAAGHAARVRAKLYRKTGVAPRFHNRARHFGPQLVHAHFASGGQTAIPLARALGVPLLVTLHGADVTIRGASARYQPVIQAAARFICVSGYIRERALHAGFPAEKLVVHYIGIDRALYLPVAARPETGVIFVGRLVEKKGCQYLLRAMRIVQRTHPECALTVIGDGPMRNELEELARFLNLNCSFLGTQPGSVVRERMAQSRVVCVPSVTAANGDSEGLPTVLAEAQAMGLPVVSTMHAGIPEMVDSGTTGFLLAERDYQGMAEALMTLLADDALWNRFHRAAIERIAVQFDLAKQTEILEDIYSGVL
jgi:glycosyltransferase involved in cell wall biosynthesis